jgi:organic hydroperoxide reductase OsmC/OhrA
MQALYTAEATAIGDGRNGEVRSSDGVIDEQIALTLRAVGGLRLPGRFSCRNRP